MDDPVNMLLIAIDLYYFAAIAHGRHTAWKLIDWENEFEWWHILTSGESGLVSQQN